MLRRILYKIKGLIQNKESKVSIIQGFINSGIIEVGRNTVFEHLKFSNRSGMNCAKSLLKIGNDSVVNGSFIIENDGGNIKVGDRSFVGGGHFISIDSIEIGNDVLISWGCTFMDNNAHSLVWSERANDVLDWKKGLEENKSGYYKDWSNVKSLPIIVKDKVWIGFDVVILKGVTIGEGSIIGAKSVVTKDIPAWTVVAGNPAVVVREIPENER